MGAHFVLFFLGIIFILRSCAIMLRLRGLKNQMDHTFLTHRKTKSKEQRSRFGKSWPHIKEYFNERLGEHDFDFSMYIRRCVSHDFHHQLHIGATVWGLSIILLILAVLEIVIFKSNKHKEFTIHDAIWPFLATEYIFFFLGLGFCWWEVRSMKRKLIDKLGIAAKIDGPEKRSKSNTAWAAMTDSVSGTSDSQNDYSAKLLDHDSHGELKNVVQWEDVSSMDSGKIPLFLQVQALMTCFQFAVFLGLYLGPIVELSKEENQKAHILWLAAAVFGPSILAIWYLIPQILFEFSFIRAVVIPDKHNVHEARERRHVRMECLNFISQNVPQEREEFMKEIERHLPNRAFSKNKKRTTDRKHISKRQFEDFLFTHGVDLTPKQMHELWRSLDPRKFGYTNADQLWQSLDKLNEQRKSQMPSDTTPLNIAMSTMMPSQLMSPTTSAQPFGLLISTQLSKRALGTPTHLTPTTATRGPKLSIEMKPPGNTGYKPPPIL